MYNSGAIVILEDDLDDQEIMADVMKEIGVNNKLMFFASTYDAFDYLKTTTDQQLLIISDINLPIMNGLEFKKKIDNDPDLREKSIPFIFLSTSADRSIVKEAFTSITVQGFFVKSSSMAEIKDQLSLIIKYWKLCKHPNN